MKNLTSSSASSSRNRPRLKRSTRTSGWVLFQGAPRATFGATPFREGCAFWFDPNGRLPIRWLLDHAHEILRTVCFGKYVVVSVKSGDRVMNALANKAGFELLETEEDGELRYLSIE